MPRSCPLLRARCVPPGSVGRSSALGSRRSSFALLSLLFFLLPRCVSTSVGRGGEPALFNYSLLT